MTSGPFILVWTAQHLATGPKVRKDRRVEIQSRGKRGEKQEKRRREGQTRLYLIFALQLGALNPKANKIQ